MKAPLLLILVTAMSVTAFAQQSKERELDYVLRRTPDPQRGEKLYATCAACHGQAGEGVSDGSVPAIGGQHFKVVARELVEFRHGARVDTRMQHFAGSMDLAFSQQIADVAAYISSLEPKPVQRAGDDKRLAEGSEIYSRACRRCHGPTAQGNNNWFVPRLAGQHPEYLVQQMQAFVSSKRPDLKKDHAEVLGALNSDQLASVAEYLASVQPVAASGGKR